MPPPLRGEGEVVFFSMDCLRQEITRKLLRKVNFWRYGRTGNDTEQDSRDSGAARYAGLRPCEDVWGGSETTE